MTFANLKSMLAQDVNRADKETVWYPIWINRALRKIQTDVSFSCMRGRATVTIPANQTSAALPARFKELTAEQYPVTMANPSLGSGAAAEVPCEVVSREHLTTFRVSGLLPARQANALGSLSGYPVWVEYAPAGWTLNILDPASEELNFSVSHHAFLPDLVADGDTNYLTLNYPDLVENKIKAIAFMSLNDPIAAQFEAISAKLLREATLDDERRRTRGRVYRMGG
jgi:hypothetical protein